MTSRDGANGSGGAGDGAGDGGDDAPEAGGIETALDLAFERARADAEETAGFYDALFTATLFLPIRGAFDAEGAESESEARSIEPVFFEVEGAPTLLVFDTEERLALWAQEPMRYVGLRGDQFFTMFSGAEQVALNIGVAPSSVVIPREVVAWLHERAAETPVAETVAAGASLDVAAPPELAPEAVARITARLAGLRKEIDEAILFSLSVDSGQPAEERRVVLGVAVTAEGAEDSEAVAHALAQTARGAFGGARPVEVALLSGNSPLMEKARAVGMRLPILDLGSLH